MGPTGSDGVRRGPMGHDGSRRATTGHDGPRRATMGPVRYFHVIQNRGSVLVLGSFLVPARARRNAQLAVVKSQSNTNLSSHVSDALILSGDASASGPKGSLSFRHSTSLYGVRSTRTRPDTINQCAPARVPFDEPAAPRSLLLHFLLLSVILPYTPQANNPLPLYTP